MITVENSYLTGRHGKHRYGAGASSWSSSWGGGSAKHKSTELVGGLVPLPARTCFECRRSCRIGPLLSCDYCPLLFHLDCLDPPLTALPAGRWMCPNHVEQYIVSVFFLAVLMALFVFSVCVRTPNWLLRCLQQSGFAYGINSLAPLTKMP